MMPEVARRNIPALLVSIPLISRLRIWMFPSPVSGPGMGLSEAFGGHHQPDCGVNEFVAADAEVRVVRENETPCA